MDNQDVLDMVETRPHGLLVMLDDECKVPRGSDKGFLDKIRKVHAAHPRFAVRCLRARARARCAAPRASHARPHYPCPLPPPPPFPSPSPGHVQGRQGQ